MKNLCTELLTPKGIKLYSIFYQNNDKSCPMTKAHSSVEKLARQFFAATKKPPKRLESFYFCDNQKDANECADLVLQGIKRATASSLWWYELNNVALPKIADQYIVTDWEGLALCVIEVEKIEITPFNQITAKFAEIEGEGDKSLAYWKKVHWDFYHRELADTSYEPTEDMLIVCELFRVVYK